MDDWFSTWFDTEYYHLLYAKRDYTEADAFVAALFEAGLLAEGDRILELACGRGRHAIAMHEQGADVLGVDLSANSIDEAKLSEEPGLRFAVHDMRERLAGGDCQFDAVTNLFTSFGYFGSRAENAKVLANVHACLEVGGTFILDYFNARTTLANLPTHGYTEQRGQVRFEIAKEVVDGVLVKHIDVTDGGKRLNFEERVQAFTPLELEQLLEAAGFEVLAVYGSYKLGKFVADKSTRAIFWARKK